MSFSSSLNDLHPGYDPATGATTAKCPTDEYLKNGHYYVEYLTPSGATGHTEMDFITVSRCILREGERVLLNVDSATYQEMQGLVPGLRVPNEATHTLLMKDGMTGGMTGGMEADTEDGMQDVIQDAMQDCTKDGMQDCTRDGMQDCTKDGMQDGTEVGVQSNSVQLAAYYVLGDTAETEALPLSDACLRLVVLVHSQELEHDAFQHDRNADVIIFAKLFNNAAGMRVDVARDARKPLVEHLVRQTKPNEPVARVRLGADKRSIWQ